MSAVVVHGVDTQKLDNVVSAMASVSTAITATEDMPLEAIIRAILSMDARLTAQQISDIGSVWPSHIERRLLLVRGAIGADATASEQWIMRMARVEESCSLPRAVGKLGAAAAARAFEEAAAGVAGHVALLRGAAQQVATSEKLKHVVEHFLNMAKELDGESSHGSRLSIEAINRIAQTETQAGQTVLQLFVETAFTCGEADLLLFIRDMPDLVAASRLNSANLAAQVEALSVALRRVEYEVEAAVEDAIRAEEEQEDDADNRDLFSRSLAFSESAFVPDMPRPSTFLQLQESVTLSGPVFKKGPSVLSKFRPRLLVLTERRLVYFSSKASDKTGVIVLSKGAVAGMTHGGMRFELSAQAGEKKKGFRRFYFEVGDAIPNAQAWCDAITKAVGDQSSKVSYTPLSPGSTAQVKQKRGSLEVPPLPPLDSFLKVLETFVVSGPVFKRGPSKLSPFRPRLLVLTNRRLIYLSSNPSDKKGVILITPDSVAGVTHRGKRFEVSAYPENERVMRRYFFEIADGSQLTAQMWCDSITEAINKLWGPSTVAAAAAAAVAAAAETNSSVETGESERRGEEGGGGGRSSDRDMFESGEDLSIFQEYLQRFLSATQPAQAILEADKASMLAACEELTQRFDEYDEEEGASEGGGSSFVGAVGSGGGDNERGSQHVFAGLCQFAGLLANARSKWIFPSRDDDNEIDDDKENDDDEEEDDPLIDRLAHYIRIGVTFEQLERDLTVKGIDDATRLLQIAGARAQFSLPDDLEDSTLVRLGIDPEQAALWSQEYDELEDDESFLHYVAMVSRDVPKEAVAAKLLRDGEDDETVELFSQLYDYRKAFGPPKSSPKQSYDEDGDEEVRESVQGAFPLLPTGGDVVGESNSNSN